MVYKLKRGENMDLDKLRGKLTEKRKTYKDCAKHLNITITAFSNKMNGKSKFYIDEINKLASLLELTNEEKINIFLK
jgi:transcriptional regulator with XRE-family HTH domain